MNYTYIEYKQIVYNATARANHPKEGLLIDRLREAGYDGWIVCGIIRDSVDQIQTTIVYLYRKTTIEER